MNESRSGSASTVLRLPLVAILSMYIHVRRYGNRYLNIELDGIYHGVAVLHCVYNFLDSSNRMKIKILNEKKKNNEFLTISM